MVFQINVSQHPTKKAAGGFAEDTHCDLCAESLRAEQAGTKRIPKRSVSNRHVTDATKTYLRCTYELALISEDDLL